MRARHVSAVILALCVATSAHAFDQRLRSVFYDPDQVVQIAGRPGIQSTIEFGPDERVENVAVGDSSAWQVTPNRRGSIVFLKPLSATSRTNMTVVTDKRTYLFDLVAVGKDSTPLYSLKFSYPESETVAVETAAAAESTTTNTTAVQPTLAAERLNFQWKVKGAKELTPSRVFDDGYSLYIAWNASRPLPAVLTVSEAGEEGPLNYQVAGQYIVVSPLPSLAILRYGKNSTELRRVHPLPVTPQPSPPRQEQHNNHVAVAQVQPAQAMPQQSSLGTNISTATGARVDMPEAAELITDEVTGGRK